MDGKLGTYREVDTLGKSQLDLILQVYDGAIKAVTDARHAYEQRENQNGYDDIERAKRFVMHLYTTLDFDKGEQIAEKLGHLYVYALNQMNVLQATKAVSEADNIIGVLTNLRNGWNELRLTDSAGHGASTAPVSSTRAGQFTASA